MDACNRVGQLKEEIKKMVGWTDCGVELIESHKGIIKSIPSDQTYLSSLFDTLFAFETLTPSPDCPTVDLVIIQVKMRRWIQPVRSRTLSIIISVAISVNDFFQSFPIQIQSKKKLDFFRDFLTYKTWVKYVTNILPLLISDLIWIWFGFCITQKDLDLFKSKKKKKTIH